MGPRPGESEEDYRKRKRKERENETPEQRALRKAREAERDRHKKLLPVEKESEKSREEKVVKSEKNEKRDKGEKAVSLMNDKVEREKDAERREKKDRSVLDTNNMSSDNRDIKLKEPQLSRAAFPTSERERDTKEDRGHRRPRETEEERAERKARERAKEIERANREVVHKSLRPLSATPSSTGKKEEIRKRDEPIIQARPQSAQKVENDNDGDYEYEDDFADGFAEDEIANAQKAMEEENVRILKEAKAAREKEMAKIAQEIAEKERLKSSEIEVSGDSVHEHVVTGTSRIGAGDLQRQRYHTQFEKDLERATALRRLVDLESVSTTIADIAPMSEYDMYIRSFGGAGRIQASVQAPPFADLGDIEIQVDRIHTKGKGCQVPDDLGLFPERQLLAHEQQGEEAGEGKSINNHDGKEESTKQTTRKGKRAAMVGTGPKATDLGVDTAAFSSFLSKVFPVVCSLMDDNDNSRGKTPKRRKESSLHFASSATTLSCPLLEGRSVLDVSFSKVSPQYVIAHYGPQSRSTAPLAKYHSLIAMWNTNDPQLPDKVLISTSKITAICSSPTRPHLIYAGTACGSVCVWDLREPNFHHRHTSDDGMISLRSPSFSTEWLSENHDSEVKQILVVGYNSVMGTDIQATSGKEEAEHVASIDSNGNLVFWMVSGDHQTKGGGGLGDGVGGSTMSPSKRVVHRINDHDHGLHMYATVKLFKATSSNVLSKKAGGAGMVNCFEFFPSDPSQIVIGTSEIIHVSRFGSITAPSKYKHFSHWSQSTTTSHATSLRFNSIDSRVLVAGYHDGTLRLFLKDSANPYLSMLLSNAPITRIRSSPYVKWITFALDENGQFYILDHAGENKEKPFISVMVSSNECGRCSVFDVSPEVQIETRVIFGFDSGVVQVHTIMSDNVKTTETRNESWI